jgi:hypothetical protein
LDAAKNKTSNNRHKALFVCGLLRPTLATDTSVSTSFYNYLFGFGCVVFGAFFGGNGSCLGITNEKKDGGGLHLFFFDLRQKGRWS